jgi:hypothetical protein
MLRPRGPIAALLFTASIAACGAAHPPPAPPPAPTAEPVEAPKKPVDPDDLPATELPKACEAADGKLCLPPKAFVKRLCGGFFPDVALAMLAKGTPWTRGYLRMNVDAWNASGGVTSADKLVFDEEVLIVTHRAADAGGMQVSGSAGGSYDVLRWDGTCASLMGEEVTTKLPPAPKHAKIPWKSLDDKIKDALLSDAKIAKVSAERKKECKGAAIGDVSAKCVRADTGLDAAVFDYVRAGGSIPAPSKLP